MQIRKVIERRLRRDAKGTNIASDVQAVVAANVGERGRVTRSSSQQTATAGRESRRDDDGA